MAVSLKQIADRCGLSRQTVGFILSGKKAHLFRPETRSKVIAAARSLGYRPHSAAQAMASNRFNAIGLLCGKVEGSSYVHHGLLQELCNALKTHEMHLTIAFLPDEQIIHEQNRPKFLSHEMVDGLILNYTHNTPEGMETLLEQSSLPCVWLNIKQDRNAVYPDDFQAAADITRKCLQAGYASVAYYAPTESDGEETSDCHYSVADRRDGCVQVMREAGLAPLIITNATVGQAAMQIKQSVDAGQRVAVLAYSMTQALEIWGELERHQVHVPEQAGVIAFNPNPFNDPKLDAIIKVACIPQRQMGQTAVDMITSLIDEDKPSLPSQAIPYTLDFTV